MKKTWLFSLILLAGCSGIPTYTYKNKSLISNGNRENACFALINKGAYETELKYFFTEKLKENNFNITDNPKKCRYFVGFSFFNNKEQYLKSVPVWGNTGIRSINTSTQGTYNGLSTYSGNSAFTTGRISANSSSTVDYDEGIVGYQNVVRTRYDSSFWLFILDSNTSDFVHESNISIPEYTAREDMTSYVKSIYSQNNLLTDKKSEYMCEYNKCEKYYDIEE